MNDSAIDEQHRTLFDLAGQLWHSGRNNGIGAEEAVRQLIEYTHVHFTEEEVYLEKVGYPGLSDHKLRHREIFDAVDNIVNRLASSDKQILANEVSEFISEWLVKHITKEDLAYAAYVAGSKDGEPSFDFSRQFSNLSLPSPPDDASLRLKRLQTMFDDGLITQAEFETRKWQVLSEI